MVIFHRYVELPEGNSHESPRVNKPIYQKNKSTNWAIEAFLDPGFV